MKKRNVLKNKVLPTRMPLLASIVLWLLLDRTHAAGWVCGMAWTLMGCVWVAWVASVFLEKSKDLPGFGEQQ